jgi:hypothetical protein
MAHRQISANKVSGRGGRVVPSNTIANTDDERLLQAKKRHEDALWKACHDYEYQFFSGGAHAQILDFKMNGPTQAIKNKAIAVQMWILNLWKEYYTRKARIWAAADDGAVRGVSLDFHVHGTPPYTVAEMMTDVVAYYAPPRTP